MYSGGSAVCGAMNIGVKINEAQRASEGSNKQAAFARASRFTLANGRCRVKLLFPTLV